MRLFVSAILFVAAVWQVESCCLPEKFSTDFSMVINATTRRGGRTATIDAIFDDGKIHMDSINFDSYLGANGNMIITSNGRTIPARMGLEVAMDRGDSIWMSARVSIPGIGSTERCFYLDIVGDIPTGYGCFMRRLTKLANDTDGHRVFQMRVKNIFTDTVTVDEHCAPIKEIAVVNVGGTHMSAVAHFSNTQVGDVTLPRKPRPSKCVLKNTITLPPLSEGGPASAISEEIEILESGRRKRAIDTARTTLHRLARDAIGDVASEFFL